MSQLESFTLGAQAAWDQYNHFSRVPLLNYLTTWKDIPSYTIVQIAEEQISKLLREGGVDIEFLQAMRAELPGVPDETRLSSLIAHAIRYPEEPLVTHGPDALQANQGVAKGSWATSIEMANNHVATMTLGDRLVVVGSEHVRNKFFAGVVASYNFLHRSRNERDLVVATGDRNFLRTLALDNDDVSLAIDSEADIAEAVKLFNFFQTIHIAKGRGFFFVMQDGMSYELMDLFYPILLNPALKATGVFGFSPEQSANHIVGISASLIGRISIEQMMYLGLRDYEAQEVRAHMTPSMLFTMNRSGKARYYWPLGGSV